MKPHHKHLIHSKNSRNILVTNGLIKCFRRRKHGVIRRSLNFPSANVFWLKLDTLLNMETKFIAFEIFHPLIFTLNSDAPKKHLFHWSYIRGISRTYITIEWEIIIEVGLCISISINIISCCYRTLRRWI